jgi:hypothetical protein
MSHTDKYMCHPDSTRERFKVAEAFRKSEAKKKEKESRPDIRSSMLKEVRKSVSKVLCKEDQVVSDFIDSLIAILPLEMIKKIYIKWFRLYWRSYVPLTAQVPPWHARKNYVDKTLWSAIDQNIHFLHLPFNTLDSMKEWIMGCQCDFCRGGGNISRKKKRELFKVADEKNWFFPLTIPSTTVAYQYAPDPDFNANNLDNQDHNIWDDDILQWDGGHKLNKSGLRANYHYDCFYGTPYEHDIKWGIRDTRRPLEFSYREPISFE